MEIKGEHYAGDDTNLSMSEVYNQIIAKCEFETRDEVLGSMLDSDKITPYVNIKQKFLREYVSAGEGSRAQNGFKEIVKSGQNGAIPYSSYDAWYCREWYFKWNFNPDWQLRYNLRDIESVLETDSNGNYINQWKILQKMKQTRFFPALVSVGKSSVELSYKNQKQNGTIEMDDYLVISCNGNRENTEEAATKFDNDNITAAGGQGYLEDNGILKYIGGESGMFSPRDEETTNYVIFSGSMILNPVMDISGSSFWGGMYRVNKPDTTFSEVLSTVDYLMKGNTCPVSNNGDGGFYCQQFYTSVKPTDEQTPNNSINLIYPFVNEDKQKSLAYNYSDKGDKTDKFDKVPVLECELRIGDSYLEEYETGDKQKTAYRWTKARASFTIGIDPNIGDYIVGKEYELANTVNGRFSNERGTAIPIKKSDALTGEVHFKIIGLVNTWWNEITRRHPTMFRHTSYQDHYRLLLNNVSSIWLKSFNMKIISDNNGYDTGNSNKDLLYISLEQLDYLKKKDDITFKINTMPTTDELIRLGINSNVSNTNVVNMSNSTPLETIVSKGTKERPERIFIDEYYNLYSKPKVIMETTLKDNLNYPMQKMYNFTGFKNMIPMKNIQNLKYNTITLTLRQL